VPALPPKATVATQANLPWSLCLKEARSRCFCLVSLVSVWGRNWCYICGTIEKVAAVEILEIANIHAVFMQVTENMIG
jgi:hypothetical protein